MSLTARIVWGIGDGGSSSLWVALAGVAVEGGGGGHLICLEFGAGTSERGFRQR